jgi:hypothetical protein
MINRKRTMLHALAIMCLVAPLGAGCASDAQLKRIAEEEGITLEEARRRQLSKAGDIEEAIPGSISGLIGGGDF